MKNINFLILATFLITGSIYVQGYVEDSFEEISQLDNYSKEGFGFADDIPVRKTLEKYVPAIGNQRKTGSCVAWATTYYNLSIIYNRMFGITSFRDKYSHSFDPWFTYSQVNRYANKTTDCMQGLRFSQAFDFLENFGAKKLFLPPYDMSCSAAISEKNYEVIERYSSPYKISKVEYEYAYNFDPIITL